MPAITRLAAVTAVSCGKLPQIRIDEVEISSIVHEWPTASHRAVGRIR